MGLTYRASDVPVAGVLSEIKIEMALTKAVFTAPLASLVSYYQIRYGLNRHYLPLLLLFLFALYSI